MKVEKKKTFWGKKGGEGDEESLTLKPRESLNFLKNIDYELKKKECYT